MHTSYISINKMSFTYKWKTNQNIVFSKEAVGRWTDLCRAPLLYPPLSTNHRTQKHCFGILLEDPVFCEVLSQSGWKKRPSNWGWSRPISALSSLTFPSTVFPPQVPLPTSFLPRPVCSQPQAPEHAHSLLISRSFGYLFPEDTGGEHFPESVASPAAGSSWPN